MLGDSTVTLMDIDEGRLDTMQRLGEKLIEGEGSALRVESTTDQRESLDGADFVIAAISVGGFDAWANDLEIPARYGIVMHVADSVGPGGIMRAMRNIPVLAEVARNVAEVAPDAYVFNYTNPAPTEAMAMRGAAPSVKTYALCSCTGHPGSAEWLAGEAGVAPDQIAMPPVVGGINHCASVPSCGCSTAPTRCRWCARTRPTRWSPGRSTPTACCPTAGATGSSTSRRCSGSRASTPAPRRA